MKKRVQSKCLAISYTSRRIFHRPMISQKRRSRASQTHILGPKKFLKQSSSQDAFVNPSSILWSKTFRVRFSFFQLTALPGRGPFWPAGLQSSSPSAIVRCGCTSTARDWVWIHTLKLSYLAYQLSEWSNSCQFHLCGSSPNHVASTS